MALLTCAIMKTVSARTRTGFISAQVTDRSHAGLAVAYFALQARHAMHATPRERVFVSYVADACLLAIRTGMGVLRAKSGRIAHQ